MAIICFELIPEAISVSKLWAAITATLLRSGNYGIMRQCGENEICRDDQWSPADAQCAPLQNPS